MYTRRELLYINIEKQETLTSISLETRMPTVNLIIMNRVMQVPPTHAITARTKSMLAATALPLPP